MARAAAQLGIDIGDLTAPHEVDEFLTADLNHAADTWDGLTVPDGLKGLAEATWAAANVLVGSPHDATACAELDRLSGEYAALYAASAAIASDETAALVRAAKNALQARLELKNERIERLRAELRSARGEG